MAKRYVEQGARRHRMRNSDCVDAVRSHQREVLLDLRQIVVLAFVRVGPKSTVTDAFDVKFIVAGVNKLSDNVWSGRRRGSGYSDDLGNRLSRHFREGAVPRRQFDGSPFYSFKH